MLAGSCWGQIAYVKNKHLYVLPRSASGQLKKSVRPVLICSVDPRFAGELTLAWSAAGEIEQLSSYKQFGVVKPVHGAKIRNSADVLSDFPPVHSPDGRHYLEEFGAQDGSDHWTRHCVAIGDLTTGKTLVIPKTRDAKDPAYSKDGNHFFWIFGKSRRLERVDSGGSSKRKVIASGVTAFAVRR